MLCVAQFKGAITFRPYSSEDLIRILRGRVGGKVVDSKALELIAKKVAGSGGDARKALEMVSNAVSQRLAVIRTQASTKSKSTGEPIVEVLVSIRDVIPVINSEAKEFMDRLEGMDTNTKVVLCALTVLAKHRANKPTTLGKLRDFVWDVMADCPEQAVDPGSFLVLLSNLEDYKMLRIANSERTFSSILDSQASFDDVQQLPLSLGQQLEEVEVAVAQILGKERFFADVLKRADIEVDKFDA
jgi:Cdc6-like AAA superfamily ATPase